MFGHGGLYARQIVGVVARSDDEATIDHYGAADVSVVVATVDVTRWASFLLLFSIIYELIHEIVLFILMQDPTREVQWPDASGACR